MNDLTKMTDIELATVLSGLYEQFMRIQGNLIAVNQEISKRAKKPQEKENVG
jgi:hypothetical protein